MKPTLSFSETIERNLERQRKKAKANADALEAVHARIMARRESEAQLLGGNNE
jgi:hypothetical protein